MHSFVRSRHLLPVVVALTLAGGACASSGGTRAQRNRDVLTEEELAREPGRSLLETIEALRPEWLSVRSSRTFASETYVSVIVDGMRQMEGGDALRTYRTSQALKLEYMSAADATTRYGVDMAGGAIIVTLKR